MPDTPSTPLIKHAKVLLLPEHILFFALKLLPRIDMQIKWFEIFVIIKSNKKKGIDRLPWW